MINQFLIFILGLIFIFPIIDRHPEFSFWLFITLLFDPTGHLTIYINKTTFGGVNYVDLFFILSFIPLFSRNIKLNGIFNDVYFKRIFIFLFIFMLYRILIHGIIVPDKSLKYIIRYMLIRERIPMFGFFLLVPTYIIAKRNLGMFYKFIVLSSFISVGLFFITLLSGINIIPFGTLERYRGTGILRYGMLSNGLSLFTIPLIIIVYFFKINVKYKRILFWGAILTISSIVLSLQKIQFIYVVGVSILSFIILSKISEKVSLLKIMKRAFIPILFTYLFISATFSNYISYAGLGFKDISTIMSGNVTYSHGRKEGRFLHQIPAHFDTIKKYPFFGAGFGRFYEQTEFEFLDYDVTDLPITGHLAQYGFIGISFYLIFYYLQLLLIFRVIKLLKKYIKLLDRGYIYEILISVVAMTYLLNRFTFLLPNAFIELTREGQCLSIMVAIAILLAFHSRLKEFETNILDNRQNKL